MKLYLIGKPRLEWTEFARFARDEGLPEAQQYMVEPPSDGETIAEIAGRVCYMSFGKGRKTNREYLTNIITQQHYSVLEHANWTFIITGISRSLTHELVRHRHFSFSQLSQRYVDESAVEFITPSLFEVGTPEWDAYQYAVQGAKESYNLIAKLLTSPEAEATLGTLDRKAIRQAARAVLPNATETKIVVTGNARTWREFIQKRNSPYADPEIRALAAQILERLDDEAPGIFGDLSGWEADGQ